MICPQCENLMEYGNKSYSCEKCGITYDEHSKEWTVPEDKQPSEKQINTILFINSRLNTEFRAITKRQAWKRINKWFDEAKNKAAESEQPVI